MPIPLSVLTGLSTTLRAPVLDAMLDATSVAIVVDQDELTARGVLSWRVLDRSGPIDAGEITVGDDCGACQLIESLVPLVEALIARAHWDHVVLAAPPAMEARPLVNALLATLPELTVDTVTCVVDAVLLVAQLSGDELLAERGLALGLPDRRNVAELTARQIEYADVCVLANAYRSTAPDRLENLLLHLNPRTTVVPASPTGTPTGPVARTARFDFSAAESWAGWYATAADLTPTDRVHPSGDGITTVLWRSTRPLHPARLSEALEDIVDVVVRSRGIVWLANRPTQKLRWESAGYSASLGDLGEWSESNHLAECTVVATGVGLDPARLQSTLDACLLTESELATLDWTALDDPFAGVL